MADWSQLPQELVFLISKRIETRFDVVRFRSVCSSWRCSSFPPKAIYTFPRFPQLKIEDHSIGILHRITRNTVFIVRLQGANQTAPDHPACWLVSLRYDGADPMKMRLLKPLADSELEPIPENFPKVLDLTNFQVIELGHQYTGQYGNTTYHGEKVTSRCYRDKVAFLRSKTNSDDFIMLASFRCLYYWLGFLRSGEDKWTVLEIPGNHIHDIISFNGKLYAMIGKKGTIVIDRSFNLSFIENVSFPTSRNFLVLSGDNLLAVEMLFLVDRFFSERQKVVGFRIFRLDEEEQKWDEMESLGDRILFLGLHQAISASASDFFWGKGKGNLIFYCSGLSTYPDNDKSGPFFVFDLDTATASALQDCPAYRNLFWPPPKWVVTCPDSANSVASAVTEIEYEYPDSHLAISARDEVPSPSSKCRSKCFCF